MKSRAAKLQFLISLPLQKAEGKLFALTSKLSVFSVVVVNVALAAL